MKEFKSLSEKIREQVIYPTETINEGKLKVEDVKESIKGFEEWIKEFVVGNVEIIKELHRRVGRKLISEVEE